MMSMMYQAYQNHMDLTSPWRTGAAAGLKYLNLVHQGVADRLFGHFATLLRGTVKTLLQDHDVYITDWHNPRDIPLHAGRFGLEDYTDHLITFLDKIGPRAHMVAICQPSVSALAAAAVMSEDNHP